MTQSANINELATALAKAQGQIEGAKKDSSNPFFKSSYADLASVWDACRKPLSDNGLSITQTTTVVESQLYLETMLMHSSGQWQSGILPINPVKPDPQGLGSAITYMRRYGLQSMVGVAPEDDDGNAASGKQKPKVEEPSGDALKETSTKHREFILKNLPAAKSVSVYANNINSWKDAGELTGQDYEILKEAITVKHRELTEKESK